jgi:hypothetical protein
VAAVGGAHVDDYLHRDVHDLEVGLYPIVTFEKQVLDMIGNLA